MLLVVSLEILGFELSEWVIQRSCSINEKAIPLGTIHIVHNHFMGMEGNSLLPFDRMVWEWKQNHWINQGKQCATLLSCPSVFHRLIFHRLRERRKDIYPFWYSQAWQLPPKVANSEVNTQALQFRTLNMVNETRDVVQSKKDHR